MRNHRYIVFVLNSGRYSYGTGSFTHRNLFKKPLLVFLENFLRRCVVIFYISGQARRISIVLYTPLIPFPFNGGSNSNENAVFFVDLILSTKLIVFSILSELQNYKKYLNK